MILSLAILCGFSPSIRGQNQSPQIRLEKALENARSITNVEIQYDDMLWIKGKAISAAESNEWKRTMSTGYPFANDYTRISHITYSASGEKYRIESHTESPQTTNLVKLEEKAFDGKLWSSISSQAATLEQDSRASMAQQDGDNQNDLENPLNPLLQPFLFLSRSSDDCVPCALRFVDLRSPDILNGLNLPDGENSNGVIHLSFRGLPRSGVDQLWSITIDDADPDFMPRRISDTVYAGNRLPFDAETSYTLSGYTNIGAHHFPTKLAYTAFYLPTNHLLAPTLASTGMVTVVSIKVPTQIPASTFRLDESKVLHIWNTGETKGYGVGLVLGEAASNVVVKRVVLDSPAGAQNEIHAGDLILSIAESNAPAVPVHAGKADLSRAAALLQGAKGTAVQLTVVPSGKDDSQPHVVTLVRGDVRSRLSGGLLLTNGMKAPDIEMVTLTNRSSEHLSDYAGKIVVLEIWASWCPPCQKTMADLQLDPARYPNWKDKVVLIAASVDDTADIAAKRIQAKGWNQTHNVWLKSKDIQSYHVGGIPAAYVVDAN